MKSLRTITVAVLIIASTISTIGAYAQTASKAQAKASVTKSATTAASTTKPADVKPPEAAAATVAPLEIIKASDSFVTTYDKYFAASDMLVEARTLVKALESRQHEYEDALRTEFPKQPGYSYNRSTHQFEPPKPEPPKTEAAAK